MKTILFAALLLGLSMSCVSESALNESQKLADSASVKLKTVRSIRLEDSPEVSAPIEITSLQVHQDGLYILDGFKLQQAFIYNFDGRLMNLVGKPGQGPGEYRLPGGFCRTDDRIHMVHQGKNYSVFDDNGEFLHRRSKVHPGAIGNRIYPGPDGTAFVTFYSRYTPGGTIYHVDQDGALIHLFSPPDNDFVRFWDMVSPMGNLVVADQQIAQMFVHKYEVQFFDLDGALTHQVKLGSSIYNPPDFEAAKQLPKDKKKLQAFARAYTLVEGFYALGEGYITQLSYTHLGDENQVIEFWDSNFNGLGRSIVPTAEKVVGTHGEQVLFYNGDTSELIWREPNLEDLDGQMDSMKSAKLAIAARD